MDIVTEIKKDTNFLSQYVFLQSLCDDKWISIKSQRNLPQSFYQELWIYPKKFFDMGYYVGVF